MNKSTYPYVSIVVIGRNEQSNLDSTFKSILSINYPKEKYEIIYVDTNSTDESVEIAKTFTSRVFIEKRAWSTPGLARNKGLVEARYDIVHFIDGDITINQDYIRKAVEIIKKPKIDAVYGYLNEKSSAGINAILLAHWNNRKEGYHKATGGGGTYKKDALLSINGYDERIRKGQETELGERFLSAGYRIWFMNEQMGIHDYGVNSAIDLIRIYILDGYNKSHLHLTKGQSDFYKLNRKHSINNLLFFLIFFLVLSLLIYFIGPIGLLYTLFLFYAHFLFKYLLIRKVRDYKELQYFFTMYSMKFFTFIGQIKFFIKCLNRSFYKSVILQKEILT